MCLLCCCSTNLTGLLSIEGLASISYLVRLGTSHAMHDDTNDVAQSGFSLDNWYGSQKCGLHGGLFCQLMC